MLLQHARATGQGTLRQHSTNVRALNLHGKDPDDGITVVAIYKHITNVSCEFD